MFFIEELRQIAKNLNKRGEYFRIESILILVQYVQSFTFEAITITSKKGVLTQLMHDKLGSIINSVVSISSHAMKKLQSLVQYHNIDKGCLISEVGKKNNHEYFVLEGICKSFLYSLEGEEITLSFFMSDSVLSPYTTRNKDGKSILNIRALVPTIIASIEADAFEKLMIEDLEIRHFGNTVLRNELMEKVEKEIGLASMAAKDRLQNLRTKYPNIENLIPHSDIASYLGITTISLSRLRTKS